MNTKLSKWLVIACGILAIIIILEWQYYTYAKKQLFAKNNDDIKSSYTASVLPQIKLGQKVEENYADMVNRPLFIEGRRPVEESETEEAEQASVTKENFEWVLDGVYIHGNTSMALFSRARQKNNEEKFKKLNKGGSVDGWQLIEIEPDRVVLEQNGENHELTLRKPKPTLQPPKPAAAPKKSNKKPAVKQGNNPFQAKQPVENPFLKKITQ